MERSTKIPTSCLPWFFSVWSQPVRLLSNWCCVCMYPIYICIVSFNLWNRFHIHYSHVSDWDLKMVFPLGVSSEAVRFLKGPKDFNPSRCLYYVHIFSYQLMVNWWFGDVWGPVVWIPIGSSKMKGIGKLPGWNPWNSKTTGPQKHQFTITWWWFQIFFIFTPKLVEMIQFDWYVTMFQMGWNHQLDQPWFDVSVVSFKT